MAKLEIETKSITNGLLYLFAAIGVIGLLYLGFVGMGGVYHASPSVSTQPTVAATPTPVQYEVTNPVTISYLTSSGGFPQVGIQEDGRVFKVDWNTYDRLRLEEVVQFTITGTEQIYSSTVYDATLRNVVSYGYYYDYDDGFPIIYGSSVVNSGYNYPWYYYDAETHTAWQWDGRDADRISIKSLRGEKVIRGRPPNT